MFRGLGGRLVLQRLRRGADVKCIVYYSREGRLLLCYCVVCYIMYTPMGIVSPLHSTKYKVAYEAGAQALYRICVSPSLTTGLHDV